MQGAMLMMYSVR